VYKYLCLHCISQKKNVCQEPFVELQQLVQLSGLTNPCLLTRCCSRFTCTGDVHALAAVRESKAENCPKLLVIKFSTVEYASIVQIDRDAVMYKYSTRQSRDLNIFYAVF
jgi:hypothetical protein